MKQIWYHDHCMDGFGSLAAYLTANPDNSDDTKLIPMSYNDSFDLSGVDEVIMLDFSVKADVMAEICKQVSKVLVIDHHKTAKEELGKCDYMGFDNLELIFDMDKSGAVLTWEYFHPGKEVPLILQYIQDRDLWQWKLNNSKDVSAYLKNQGFEDKEWLKDLILCPNGIMKYEIHGLIDEGRIIRDVHRKIYENTCKNAQCTKLDDDLMISVNSPEFQSEIGDYLNKKIIAEKLPQKFVAIWWDSGKDIIYSLRSKGDFDVSEVAKRYGGGGHKNSAGFRVPKMA